MKRLLMFFALLLAFSIFSWSAGAQSTLTVTVYTHMHITWVASADVGTSKCPSPCVVAYNIFRSTTPGGEDMTAPVNSQPIFATSYDDYQANTPGTYYYKIQSVGYPTGLMGSGGTLPGAVSTEFSGVFPKPVAVWVPAPPTGQGATPN